MSGFSAKANELLVEIYRNVQILEQNELKKQRLNISINEMHMIELIAKGKTGMTVSEIAQQLKVTKPSVTVAVNKLVQKGYCEKQRLPGDGRAVQVMLTPEGKKVEEFHRRRYTAENCFVVCSGRIGERERQAVAALAERIPHGGDTVPAAFPAPVTEHEAFVGHPGAVQSSVRIGRMLFPRQHPDFLGMQVVASALGGYFGSRLMQNLREERGYTYGVVAAMVNFEQAGYFAVATQVGTDVTRDALREIYAEIERLRTEPMPDEELSLVKNIMIGEMMRILDGPFGIADVTIENILCGRDHTVIGENIRRIQAMTPADIQRLAQKYLAREDLVTVIAGDPIPEERQAPEEKADRQ